MRLSSHLSAALIAAGILAAPAGFAADPVKLLGFQSMPFSAVGEGKKLSGPGYEFVADLFKAAGIAFVAEGLPFGRVIEELNGDNAVAVFLTRTPAREQQFTWIAGLIEDDGFVFVPRAGSPAVTSFDQAKTLKSVGVLATSALAAQLTQNGVTNVDPVSSDELNAKKLVSSRIDAWFTSSTQGRYVLKQEQIAQDAVTIGPKVVPVPQWIVGAKGLPKETLEKLQAAFAAAKNNGRYAAFRASVD